MRKKSENKKGFTLAELLVVVAIVAVLVAIAIPIFAGNLEKSREATDVANVRAAYATLAVQYLDKGTAGSISVPATQKSNSWVGGADHKLETMKSGSMSAIDIPSNITSGSYYNVKIDGDGDVEVVKK